MNKKRYIPLVVIGALILSLIAILPAFGADEVSFLDPTAISTPVADTTAAVNNWVVTLTDDGADEQEYGRQGGEIGLLVEDDNLNKPIRRVLVPEVDGVGVFATRGATDPTNFDPATPATEAQRTIDLEAHNAEITVSRDELEVGDYVFVGEETVRRVTKVGDPMPLEPAAGAADHTFMVPVKVNPRASTEATDVNDAYILEHTRVMFEVPLGTLTTEAHLESLKARVTTLEDNFDGTATANTNLEFDLDGKSGAKLNDAGDAVVLGFSIEGMWGDAATDLDTNLTVVVTYDLDGPTNTAVTPNTGTGAEVNTNVILDFYDVANSWEPQVVTLDRPFAKTSTGDQLYRIVNGRETDETDLPRALGNTWSNNYQYYAKAIPGVSADTATDYENRLVARSRIAENPAPATNDANDDTATRFKQRLTGGGTGRVRDDEDAWTVTLTGTNDAIDTIVASDNIEGEDITFASAGTYILAWFIEPNEAVATVRSRAHPDPVTLMLQETDEDSDLFALKIGTTSPDDEDEAVYKNSALPTIPVQTSDVVTLRATGTRGTLQIETMAPQFAGLSPAHNTTGRDARAEIMAQVTDSASGIDVDDITVLFRVVEGDDTRDWFYMPADDGDDDRISGGFEVTQALAGRHSPDDDADIYWWVMATDKAGNVGFTDQDGDDECMAADVAITVPDENPLVVADNVLFLDDLMDTDKEDDATDLRNCQPYVIKVDNTIPTLVRAETGRHWDSTLRTDKSKDKTEYRVSKADKSSVLVIFTEHLDATSVRASDFEVNGAEPVDASVYNVTVRAAEPTTEDYEGYATYAPAEVEVDAGDKLGYVFLRLSSDLNSNDTPKVELVSSVEDLAGNERDTGVDNDAVDRIAPTLTVTIDEGNRPATMDKVNLTITSDENIRRPEVAFYHVTSVDGDTSVAADSTGDGVVEFVSSTSYTAEITSSGDDGLYSVYVTAVDTAGSNTGSIGSKADGVSVDSDTKAILFERDTTEPALDINPGDGPDDEFKTDDTTGYIRIDFMSEANEYDAQTNADGDRVGDDLDTHEGVTIVSATLNGDDITGSLQSNDKGNLFQYRAPDGLAVGEHKLEVIAMDDAGNKHQVPEKATITITERKPFSLKLNPGWNLVSLPGEPADPDINVVIPAERTDISSVLAYDPTVPGLWLSASRGADGMFSGTLKNITATRGYWVETNTFMALPVSIPKQSPGLARVLPTIPVAKGWNMVPILDVDGNFMLEDGNDDRDDSTKLPTFMDGDTRGYLDGLDSTTTRVYTFNTITNRWDLVDMVEIGKGYWVYVAKAGIIVP